MNARTKLNGSATPVGDDMAASLAKLLMGDKFVDWNHQDPDIEYAGKRITLPNDPGKMGLREAADLLNRKADDEETELQAIETIEAFPLDGAVAFTRAMKKLYGWASPIPTMTFFGPQPPKLLTVDIGPNEYDGKPYQTQVSWGLFTIPGIENPISIGSKNTASGPVFMVSGIVKKREQYVLQQLANEARAILRDDSIYKGKAIRLRVEGDGTLNPETPPTFMSTRYIVPSELILNPDELGQIQASLWSPIENTQMCRDLHIPLKRGVLLEGPYGIGKTMTANVTSKHCTDNGWTFILLDDIRALKDALLFAQRYAPAVRCQPQARAYVRDQRGNDLLNTIDGVLSKNSEVITVLTTNHVEKIERAMLRPGRLDAVISVRPPEAEAVERLIRLYARSLLAPTEDLTMVSQSLAGNIPATIREVVERSKLAMIGRKDRRLIASDLLTSASGMKRHLELLNFQAPAISDGDALALSLRKVLNLQKTEGGDFGPVLEALEGLDKSLRVNVMGNVISVKELIQTMQTGSKKLKDTLEGIEHGVDKIVEHHDL